MKYLIVMLLTLCIKPGFAQSFLDFKEGNTIALEGVEFGYSIVRQSPRLIDTVEYTALNIEWYITNKERFSKVFLLGGYNKSTGGEVDLSKNICLGRLHVSNAVGTNTKDRISNILQEPNMVIEVFRKQLVILKKKNRMEAYNLQPGEMLTASMTVVVPKGAKPNVSLQAFLSDIY